LPCAVGSSRCNSSGRSFPSGECCASSLEVHMAYLKLGHPGLPRTRSTSMTCVGLPFLFITTADQVEWMIVLHIQLVSTGIRSSRLPTHDYYLPSSPETLPSTQEKASKCAFIPNQELFCRTDTATFASRRSERTKRPERPKERVMTS
jgi:hypothetical protein